MDFEDEVSFYQFSCDQAYEATADHALANHLDPVSLLFLLSISHTGDEKMQALVTESQPPF